MRSHGKAMRALLGGLAILAGYQLAEGQFVQQGTKLVGNDAQGYARQGESVALSYTGSSAIVGGSGDMSFGFANYGATWTFTRTVGLWSQDGSKLVKAYLPRPDSYQGYSIGLSSDGNTALVGAPYDDSASGGAFAFRRQGGPWGPMGEKLIGFDMVGRPRAGTSVAISGDGKTFAFSGPLDSMDVPGQSAGGAVFVWVLLPNGLMRYQGPKLVGPRPAFNLAGDVQGNTVALSNDGNTLIVGGGGSAWVFTRTVGVWDPNPARIMVVGATLGPAVALSYDGNTALVGVPSDNGMTGAAAVFTRTGGVWQNQGNKLVGSDVSGAAHFGHSVALSSDGSTAIIGGPSDSNATGAAWVFKRTAGVWSQYGNKLVGSGAKSAASQGWSVGISGDGRTAIVGGPTDSSLAGAAWVYNDAPIATSTITIRGGNTSPWLFTGTGLTIQFTPANSGDIRLTVSRYNSYPGGGDVTGLGLANVGNVFWAISVDSGTVNGTFDITLDLSAVVGISNYSTLHLVKRSFAYSPWTDQGMPSNAGGAPWAIKWSGLTSFSEFAIAGGPDNPLGVDKIGQGPAAFSLEQNYPNPFNPTTEISYQVPGASDVQLVVYDLLGREVAVLVNEREAPGSHTVSFDGSGLASGVYLYRLTAGNFVQTRTMILIR